MRLSLRTRPFFCVLESVTFCSRFDFGMTTAKVGGRVGLLRLSKVSPDVRFVMPRSPLHTQVWRVVPQPTRSLRLSVRLSPPFTVLPRSRMATTDEPLAPAASRLDVRALLQAQAASSTRPSVVVDKEDDLQYDLGHLCAFDPTPVDAEALREDREGHLLRTARDNMQLLANQLYGLLANAQEKSVIRLPPPVTQLPREKPLPEARQLTRWEKFAKEKGIVKHKRSKMVWDEVSGPITGRR
eukprot:scaffold122837_cov78-Phaeocystis_antarctica.AAC.3